MKSQIQLLDDFFSGKIIVIINKVKGLLPVGEIIVKMSFDQTTYDNIKTCIDKGFMLLREPTLKEKERWYDYYCKTSGEVALFIDQILAQSN